MICEQMPQVRISDVGRTVGTTVRIQGVRVHIERTKQRLGGSRAWFNCPTCGRRCAILYPTRCRLCLKLRYQSELLSREDRTILQGLRLRARLGQCDGNLSRPLPRRPKWMRWHTYFAWRKRIYRADQRQLVWAKASLDRIRRG